MPTPEAAPVTPRSLHYTSEHSQINHHSRVGPPSKNSTRSTGCAPRSQQPQWRYNRPTPRAWLYDRHDAPCAIRPLWNDNRLRSRDKSLTLGDDISDAGEVGSDGSDFWRDIVCGGCDYRTFRICGCVPDGAEPELSGLNTPGGLHNREALCADNALGLMSRLLSILPLVAHSHRASSSEKLAEQAQRSVALVQIRFEFSRQTRTASVTASCGICASCSSRQSGSRAPSAPISIYHRCRGRTAAAQIRAKLEDQDSVGSSQWAEARFKNASWTDLHRSITHRLQIDLRDHHLPDYIE
ncbi:hypothetical protein H4582DRAFT_2072618 [Lactarius indigo]|nr:hypothetical protein H4582DRAFT_2072618 [Lactarius indigo]